MTPRRNARRLAREMKHYQVFDLDDASPWPLPEPTQPKHHELPQIQRRKEEPCKRTTSK
jgi:hypothetical protein